jgi:murein L,D-transpeptidase YafK
MTDGLIEEIYSLARESLKSGQDGFEVHAFPFRMTQANLARFEGNPNMPFWLTLKQGYDFFEKYRLTPAIAVCERRYVVNVKMSPMDASSIQPDARCPRFQRPTFEPFTPKPYEQQVAEERIVAPGPKTRQFANVNTPQSQDAIAATINQPAFGLGAPVETGSTTAPAVGFSQ